MYQALYRTYRPRTFDDVAGQEHITDTLRRQVADGRLSHAYLFTGTRGTGKTTCAKLLARAVNCEAPENGNPCNRCPSCLGIEDGSILDVLELDAASNNGVDHVRALRDEAIYSPAAVMRRVYIVDEVHMLSTAAFNALLKILEEPPAHLMFILATTELYKVPATIKSRCQQFAFKRILPDVIAARLGYVAECEHIELTADAARLLARLAEGGMRDALSLLDQCAGGGAVDESAVLQALGMAGNLETVRLMEALAAGQTADALTRLGALYQAGKDMKAILGELTALIRDLLIRKTAPREGRALLTGGYDETALRTLGERVTAPRLMQMLTVLQGALEGLARSQTPRVDAELCLIRLADETLDGSYAGLAARVARLESGAVFSAPRAEAPQEKKEPQAPSSLPKEAPPADEEEDLPPWEETESVAEAPQEEDDDDGQDAPPWEAEPTADAPQDEDDDAEEYRPAEVEDDEEDDDAAAPEPPPPAETGEQDIPDWRNAVLPALKGKIPPQIWPFLSNAVMTTWDFDGETLWLTVNSAVTRAMVDKPEVLDPVSRATEQTVGRAVPVLVRMKESAVDKLNDLMAFGQKFSQAEEGE